MPKALPAIKTSEFSVYKGRVTCNVEIFLPHVKLKKWLELYITTHISKGLPGSSVQRVEHLKENQLSPWGKSRILYGLRMGQGLPSIFNADVQQTVWDYGNGRGGILVVPLNGFMGGYISVDLQETLNRDGVPGVLGKFNLEHLDIKLFKYINTAVNLTEDIIESIPFFRMISHLPFRTLDVVEYVPLVLIADIIISHSLKIPLALFGIHQKSL